MPLMVCMLLLLLSGLAVLYGTSLASDTMEIFHKQLLFALIALGGFIFVSLIDYHALSKQNRLAYIAILATLLYLLFLGPEIRGGKRWIDLGIGTFQPSEFVKISVAIGLARLLHLRRGQINSWKILFWSMAYAGLPAALVLLQPDLGSALVTCGIWTGLILMSPIKKKYIAVLGLIGLLLAAGVWQFGLKDFQKDRIKVFMNPELDPRGKGYNVRQATIAIGSGGIFGRGLASGLQSQNRFLPERQTDFIFAAGSEQIGFFGSLGLLSLFVFAGYRLLAIAKRARDDLGMYLALGVFFLLWIHAIVNIGMNMGLMPVTGIPLPFLSAGGSGLVVMLFAFGIAQNVAIQSKILRF
ncbi:MAG: rod shape-determining protein RodA [Candidatus Doudnabacteria bacterium]|nr:rod shape-determining protein RodA [Candidatus Doudnabacteria bacterium]